MSLKIIKAGIQDTLQDMGRYGYRYLGINPGGAMDRYGAALANLLVGNNINKPVAELHFPSSVFLFQEPALISICGADFSACINGETIPTNQPIMINKSSILHFNKAVNGARAYLAVYNGFHAQDWLGSGSTHLKVKLGGYQGRSFQKDDQIIFDTSNEFLSLLGSREYEILPWKLDNNWGDNSSGEILIMKGQEWNRLTEEAKETFNLTSFVITNQSDRMGYRLNNLPLPVMTNGEMISSAVSFGTIQLLPDGKLIVLMADHQTTGGYPKIAHVISAHHSKLAQMAVGEKINFRMVNEQTAEELYCKQQDHLTQLQNACFFRLQQYFNKK